MKDNSDFYFTHSYELKNYNNKNILAKVVYKNKDIVAITKNSNF